VSMFLKWTRSRSPTRACSSGPGIAVFGWLSAAFGSGLFQPDVANEPRTFTVQTGDFMLSPRKLLFHCLLHETRHWAQIALAIRNAGLTPPGNHDLFYSRAMR